MRAGPLQEKVRFEQSLATSDEIGGTNVAWLTQFETWVQLRMERGREALQAGRLEASNMAVVTVRSNVQTRMVTAGWRMSRNGEAWQVRSVMDGPGRNRSIEMVVERGQAT